MPFEELNHEELFYLRGISRILEVLQHNQNLDMLIQEVTEATLALYQCDRAFLMFPIDPDGDYFRVPVEVTRPEYPGAMELDVDIPVIEEQAQLMRALLATRDPFIITSEMMKHVRDETPGFVQKDFIMPLSAMLIAIRPRIGKPWAFGLHQCSHERQWTETERRLFREIGDRLADALSSRLLLEDLQKSELKYRRLVESLEQDYFLYSHDTNGIFTYVSPSIGTVLGYSPDYFRHNYHRLFSPLPINQLAMEYFSGNRSGQISSNFEAEFISADGTLHYFEITHSPHEDESGQITAWEGIAHDVTEQRHAQHALEISASVFEHSDEAILVTDSDERILQINRAFTDITGYSEHEAVGKTPRLLRSGQHNNHFFKQFWYELNHNGVWRGEIINKRKDGDVFHSRQTVTAVRNGDTIERYISVFSDITLEKQSQQHIYRLAHFDSLTSLPNRVLFSNHCKKAVARCQRTNEFGAIFFIDLDRFKDINDSLGIMIGDALIKAVAQRLQHESRQGDTVARLGGDEFALLVEDIHEINDVIALAEKTRNLFNKPFQVNSYNLHITPSIGITIFPEDADDIDILFQYADISMFKAKSDGGNRFVFYTQNLTDAAVEHIELEHDLKSAIPNNEFQLFYQPKIDVASGAIIGAEALIRWFHPQKGMIPPLNFIPLAEERGLINAIGEWVIQETCRQLAEWDSAGITLPSVAVNVAGPQFYQDGIVNFVRDTLNQHQLSGDRLEIEVTETFIMQQPERAIATQNAFKEMGCAIAIDDFGTGYSSLALLKQLPLTTLKIDQSFVRGTPEDANDVAIIQAILAMAKSLKLHVVAEGVETKLQQQFLSQSGCDSLQGYHFSKPVCAADFVQFWRNHNA